MEGLLFFETKDFLFNKCLLIFWRGFGGVPLENRNKAILWRILLCMIKETSFSVRQYTCTYISV